MEGALGRRAQAAGVALSGRWLPGLAFLAIAAGCDGSHRPEVPGGPPVPSATFETVPCGFESAPPGLDVTCGRVRVPERRDDPATGEIAVRVAVVRARDLPPPVRTAVYLDGGAGGSSVQNLTYYAAWSTSRSLRALLGKRVLVAIDRRGTGGSRPRLDCPDVDVGPLPERPAESGLFSAQPVASCRGRLVGEGVSLPAYGTQASADDVEAVRQALQLSSYDIVGASYGARWALEVVRRHPGPVRALVLDSLTPPDVDALVGEGSSLDRALARAFAECTNDLACRGRHPDPAQALAEVVARLAADPVVVATHGGLVELDGRTFVQALASMLRDGHAADDLADRIEDARAGNYDFIAAVLGAPRATGAVGALFSVACAEQMPATSLEAIELAATQLSPPVRGSLTSRFIALACPAWSVPPAPPALRAPISGAVPTLLMVGERDPMAPPSYARRAAETLRAAQVLELPRQGHQLLHLPRGADAAAAFLEDPTRLPAAAACGPAVIP